MGTSSFGLVDAESVRAGRSWFFALGVAFMALGVLAIALPFVASLTTTLVLGWLLIVGGLFQAFHGIQHRRWAGSAWGIVGGVVQVLTGVLVVGFPMAGTLVLTLVLAAFFVANGILKVIRALQHRALAGWGWLLFDGALSLALGLLISLGWPSTAVWALGLLVGIDFVMGGSAMLVIAIAAGRALRAQEWGA